MPTSTISNTITDPIGTAVSGALVTATLMPSGGFRSDTFTEVARTVSTTSNGSGAWSLALERNSNITPASTWYEIVEHIPAAQGGRRVWNITVGASNQTVLAALTTVLGPASSGTYLTQASADARYQALSAIGTDTPTTSAVGDAAAAGSSTAAARGDHRHGREAFGSPVATSPAGNSNGVATTIARSDHVHQGVGTLASGYAQATANQTGISAETSLTGLSVTVTTIAGRRIKITGHTLLQGSADTNRAELRIKEGATVLQLRQAVSKQASHNHEVTAIWVGTPSAGSHTYNLTLQGAVTGTSSLIADPTFPAFILVEDIGT